MKKFLRCTVVAVVLAVLLVSQASAFNYWDNGYILAPDKEQMAMPKPYTCEKVIDSIPGSTGSTTFTNPDDIFLAPSGDYYVADTGNSRIVRLNSKFEYVAEYNGLANGDEEDAHKLSGPSGIFVTDEGDMYVADTTNQRIVHLDPNGEYVEQFIMPESDLLYNVLYFAPTKLAINPVNNYIYVIQDKQFMTIDAANNFKGYIGANKVGFNLLNYIVMTFATDEMKDQMDKIEPEPFLNFCVANGGKIYATGATKSQRISVINTVGTNVYPSGEYGVSTYADNGAETEPQFNDICVDENEIISCIELNSGCIYQYDQNGNLLCIFGGKGTTAGYFGIPSAIVYAGSGKLVTLDKSLGRIQVFVPTDFINTVHKAVTLYEEGKYDESLVEWNTIKDNNASYSLAREFIGKITMKKGDYAAVLDDFKQSEDKDNYGKAFEKLRYQFMQKYFYAVVAVLAVTFVLVVLGIKRLNKFVKKMKKEFWDKLEG